MSIQRRQVCSTHDGIKDQKTLIAMTSVCLGSMRRYRYPALVLAVKWASSLYPFP